MRYLCSSPSQPNSSSELSTLTPFPGRPLPPQPTPVWRPHPAGHQNSSHGAAMLLHRGNSFLLLGLLSAADP